MITHTACNPTISSRSAVLDPDSPVTVPVTAIDISPAVVAAAVTVSMFEWVALNSLFVLLILPIAHCWRYVLNGSWGNPPKIYVHVLTRMAKDRYPRSGFSDDWIIRIDAEISIPPLPVIMWNFQIMFLFCADCNVVTWPTMKWGRYTTKVKVLYLDPDLLPHYLIQTKIPPLWHQKRYPELIYYFRGTMYQLITKG